MRIAVVGIGGVGGYIGAKFCSLIEQNPQKYDITFIARGEHAAAVAENGIKVVEDEETFTAKPTRVCTAEDAQETFDLILLCVKSYDIENALTALKKNIRPDTVIIPFANGVNNAETVRSLVDAKVLNGCVYVLSHIQEPGVIRKQGKVFAAVFGNTEYYGETLHIGYMFKDAGLRFKTPEEIEEAVWKKYLFISAFATLTSYYDMNIKPVYDAHYSIAKTVLEEIAAVAAAKGIDLSEEVTKALETASKLPESASTSMHLDYQNDHRTELETLTGYIVHEAQKLDLKVPKMTNIYNSLKEKNRKS
jgi:2-dehydropantoate 2-reductase